MKILTHHHKQFDFSWAKLPAPSRNTLALIAAAVVLSGASAVCALLLFSKVAHASDVQGADKPTLAASSPLEP